MFKWLFGDRHPESQPIVEAPAPPPSRDDIERAKAVLMSLDGRWTALFLRQRRMGASVFEIGSQGELKPSAMMIGLTSSYVDWKEPLQTMADAGLFTLKISESEVVILRNELTEAVRHNLEQEVVV